MTPGSCAILNVGTGDTVISFDSKNVSEMIRSKRIISDMLRRGYVLLVEVERGGEKAFERVLEFDEKNNRYIIADFDPVIAAKTDSEEEEQAGGQSSEVETPSSDQGNRKIKSGRGRPRKVIDAGTAKAVAVGRSAGG